MYHHTTSPVYLRLLEENTMTYTRPEHIQFVKDMKAAGRFIRHYNGNYAPEGPSIRCPRWDLQSVCRATDVWLHWFDTGWDCTVYPHI